MSGENLVFRTKAFAISCVNIAEKLKDSYLSRHIKGQLIRCSTSVAANYRATRLAQSKAAFIAKLSIVVEESDECEFWLDFLLLDRKSTRLNSSHIPLSRMPSSA